MVETTTETGPTTETIEVNKSVKPINLAVKSGQNKIKAEATPRLVCHESVTKTRPMTD
jgi:hypothetical protein